MKTKIRAFLKWMYLYVKGWREVYYNHDILPLELPVTHTHTHKARRESAAELYKYYLFAEDLKAYQPQIIWTPKGWYYSDPTYAIIEAQYAYDTYFQNCIKSAERALIRKAIKNNYSVREIQYDEYLDAIQEINTSKEERCGHKMTEDYTHPKKRDSIVKPVNPSIYTYGCFDENEKLVAYYMFEKITNFYHVVKGIGHKDHLRNGIMNYLFAYSVAQLSEKHECEYIVYGVCTADGDGLDRFKRQAGCQIRNVVLKGTLQQYQTLRHFAATYRLHGDVGLNYILDYCL